MSGFIIDVFDVQMRCNSAPLSDDKIYLVHYCTFRKRRARRKLPADKIDRSGAKSTPMSRPIPNNAARHAMSSNSPLLTTALSSPFLTAINPLPSPLNLPNPPLQIPNLPLQLLRIPPQGTDLLEPPRLPRRLHHPLDHELLLLQHDETFSELTLFRLEVGDYRAGRAGCIVVAICGCIG